jgi:hypothetical protein
MLHPNALVADGEPGADDGVAREPRLGEGRGGYDQRRDDLGGGVKQAGDTQGSAER